MKILFSENEDFYRKLGLKDCESYNYYFDGMRLYKKKSDYFQRYDLFVCAFYTLPHNTIITLKCKNVGIKTALCADGIFEFSNAFLNPMHKKYNVKLCHPILQDFYICVGKQESKYFRTFKPTVDYLPMRLISNKNIISLPDSIKILITTANTAYFSEAELSRLLTILLGIISVLNNRNINFDLRIFDEKLLSPISIKYPNLHNNISGGFEDILGDYSCVITTTSSIMIPSMYHQRAVCQIIYRDFPLIIQSGWNISSVEMFESSLSSFLNMDKDRMDIQTRLLLSYSESLDLTDR